MVLFDIEGGKSRRWEGTCERVGERKNTQSVKGSTQPGTNVALRIVAVLGYIRAMPNLHCLLSF